MQRLFRRHGLISLLTVLFLALPGAALAQGSERQDRPFLSGTPTYLDTEHFRIHYTTSGVDAVPSEDGDGSGVPDYVEFVARTMEEVRRVEVDDLGWNPPPPDGGEGGDERYDVYLQDIFGSSSLGGDISGYMDNFGGLIGDNPNSVSVEARSSYGYLALDHDYEGGEGLGVGLTVEDYIRVTAAHEYHHAIQAGYDGEEPYNWLWESTASWMESEVYPQVIDNLSYLQAVFKSPDTCMVGQGGDRSENRLHWYGMWVFLQALDQAHGHEAVRALWEQAITLDGYAALDAALATYGDTLDAAILRYAARNLLRDYERQLSYPVLRLEGAVRAYGEWTPIDGVQSLGTDYVELALLDRGPVTIAVTGDNLDSRVIGIIGSSAEEMSLDGGSGEIDLGRYERAYLLITNLDRERNTSSCQDTFYTVGVTPGEGSVLTDITASHDATFFLPPQVEALADPGTGQAAISTPDPASLEVAFVPLAPAALPQGYTLTAAQVQPITLAQPGAALPVDAAVLDYTAPDGGYFTVIEAASPWPTLAEYLEQNGRREGETEITYKATPALLLRVEGESGTWTSTTMIVNGLFIAIEGGAPPEVIEAVALELAP